MNTHTKHNPTILVIEDERTLLDVVKTKLEKSGFSVITSRSVDRAFAAPLLPTASGAPTLSSVEKALKHLEALQHVDAIWLDHGLLGDEDGLDFITKLRENGGRWAKLPIFVVSNTSDPELVKTYKELGVNKYYIKAEHKLQDIVEDIRILLAGAKKIL